MPNLKFTQESIDNLRPPKTGREYYWDQNTAGFGLRITATGKRVWVAKYRVNGKQLMETVATAMQMMPPMRSQNVSGCRACSCAHRPPTPREP